MSDREQYEPTLVERIRRWLWLDGPRRTDSSEANRGFYTGLTRKPVGWRFVLPVVALVALAIPIVVLVVGLLTDRGCDRPSVTCPLTASSR